MRLGHVIVSAIGIAAIPIAFLSLAHVAVVSGDSMMPTMRNGQFVLALRRYSHLRRGDVVLLRRGPEVLVKRIAYVSRDHVAPLDRPLFQEVRDYFASGSDPDDLVVPAGRVVVLGDNRTRSDDSRRFGPVPESDILGRVVAVSPIP